MGDGNTNTNPASNNEELASLRQQVNEAERNQLNTRCDMIRDAMIKVERHLADMQKDKEIIRDYLQHLKESNIGLQAWINSRDNDIVQLKAEIQQLKRNLEAERKTKEEFESKVTENELHDRKRALSDIFDDIEALEKSIASNKTNFREVKETLAKMKEVCVKHKY